MKSLFEFSSRKHQDNVGARLYTLFVVIIDVLVFLFKFHFEILTAIYRLIVRPELKDLKGETVLVSKIISYDNNSVIIDRIWP